jgi:hypothetical protein
MESAIAAEMPFNRVTGKVSLSVLRITVCESTGRVKDITRYISSIENIFIIGDAKILNQEVRLNWIIEDIKKPAWT